jgi:hypothetical protein
MSTKYNNKRFCSKVAGFLAEAQLMKYVALEPDDEAARQYVTEKCGKASFPALEYEPGFVSFFL